MASLLTREQFSAQCLYRDDGHCVICNSTKNVVVHHIMERRLFRDGGYYLDNGATVCEECHWFAESTDITADELRSAIGAVEVILPEHYYKECHYDKWGNILLGNGTRLKGELFFDESVQKILASKLSLFRPYIKHPRTWHLPNSVCGTKDDLLMKNDDIFLFEADLELKKDVVVTIKMDGENTSVYSDGYMHARSIDERNHPSRSWVKKFFSSKFYDIPPGWRVCGENLYATHSIHYTALPSYFMMFSIWDEKNQCLSWDDTVTWSQLLDIPLVPLLYRGPYDRQKIHDAWLKYVNDSPQKEEEGYVVRAPRAIAYQEYRKLVGKYVRPNHVTTGSHWRHESIKPNILK